MKPAPIRRPGFVLTAAVLLAVLGYLTRTDDDIGAAQMADALEHQARDAHERHVAQTLKEGKKQ